MAREKFTIFDLGDFKDFEFRRYVSAKAKKYEDMADKETDIQMKQFYTGRAVTYRAVGEIIDPKQLDDCGRLTLNLDL